MRGMEVIENVVLDAVDSIIEELPLFLTDEEKEEYLMRVISHVVSKTINTWDKLWKDSLGLREGL